MSAQLRLLDYNYVFDTSVGLTALTADSEFPVSNLRSFLRGKVWRTTSAANQTLVIDLKTTESIDTFLLVFDKESDITLTRSSAVRIQANATDEWSSPAVNVTLDNTLNETYGILSYFWSSAQSYRYWRLLINAPEVATGYLEISKVFLGYSTQIARLPLIGFSTSEEDLSQYQSTVYGQEYADTYPGRRHLNLQFMGVTEADKETIRSIYARLGRVKPIVAIYDPLQSDFATAAAQTFYGFLDNDFEAAQLIASYFNFEMSIREAL